MASSERSSLVTGANGYIGSNIRSESLACGYKVLGSVRSISRFSWLQHFFDEKFGPERFTLVEIPDLGKEHYYDAVLSNPDHKVCGVLLTNSVMDSMQVSPNPYIDKAVATVLVPMRVAARYPGVESVVCTGSTRAVTTPCLDTPIKGTETTWNHAAVEAAYAPTYTDAALHAHAVYSAQFVKKEQAAYWFWTRTNPHYRFNIVAVSVTWGQIVSTANQGYLSTSGFLNGPENFLVMASRLVPHWCCDVQDMAQLHVAAATGSDVTNERIFAFVL